MKPIGNFIYFLVSFGIFASCFNDNNSTQNSTQKDDFTLFKKTLDLTDQQIEDIKGSINKLDNPSATAEEINQAKSKIMNICEFAFPNYKTKIVEPKAKLEEKKANETAETLDKEYKKYEDNQINENSFAKIYFELTENFFKGLKYIFDKKFHQKMFKGLQQQGSLQKTRSGQVLFDIIFNFFHRLSYVILSTYIPIVKVIQKIDKLPHKNSDSTYTLTPFNEYEYNPILKSLIAIYEKTSLSEDEKIKRFEDETSKFIR